VRFSCAASSYYGASINKILITSKDSDLGYSKQKLKDFKNKFEATSQKLMIQLVKN
jgi:hypothetical protein